MAFCFSLPDARIPGLNTHPWLHIYVRIPDLNTYPWLHTYVRITGLNTHPWLHMYVLKPVVTPLTRRNLGQFTVIFTGSFVRPSKGPVSVFMSLSFNVFYFFLNYFKQGVLDFWSCSTNTFTYYLPGVSRVSGTVEGGRGAAPLQNWRTMVDTVKGVQGTFPWSFLPLVSKSFVS